MLSLPQEPSISIKNPRKSASEVSTYNKSRIDIPSGIDESNIETLFEPLRQDLLAISRFEEGDNEQNDNGNNEGDTVETHMERNTYESFFEIGVRVEVLRMKEETKTGKRGGWLVAVIQDFDLENDWVKVEFLSYEEKLFKLYVSELLRDDKLRLKSALF